MKDKRFIFSTLFFLFLFFSIILSFFNTNVFAQNADEILKMSPSGYVEDFVNVIDDEKENLITQISSIVDSKTDVQIAVVTLQSLGLYTIEEFSYKLLETWGVGQKEENNGILVVLSLDERKVRIEVGYGLEYLIPDSIAAQIINSYGIPYFKSSDYSQGLLNIVYQLGDIIAKSQNATLSTWLSEQGVSVPQQNGSQVLAFFVLIIFIFLFIIISSFFGRRRTPFSMRRSPASSMFGAYLASKAMRNTFFGNSSNNMRGPRGFGGGGFRGGGGFGGFGGGSSGGGGATGGW